MALTAVWVSGTVARPWRVGAGYLENVNGVPWTDINGAPDANGVTFRGVGGRGNFFYFPISTPVILNDKRARLKKVFVFYKTDTNVIFERVFVWDGPNRIWEQALGLRGPVSLHTDIVMGYNAWDIPSISMRWGLTISVNITFVNAGNILFTTAGADFDV